MLSNFQGEPHGFKVHVNTAHRSFSDKEHKQIGVQMGNTLNNKHVLFKPGLHSNDSSKSDLQTTLRALKNRRSSFFCFAGLQWPHQQILNTQINSLAISVHQFEKYILLHYRETEEQPNRISWLLFCESESIHGVWMFTPLPSSHKCSLILSLRGKIISRRGNSASCSFQFTAPVNQALVRYPAKWRCYIPAIIMSYTRKCK